MTLLQRDLVFQAQVLELRSECSMDRSILQGSCRLVKGSPIPDQGVFLFPVLGVLA